MSQCGIQHLNYLLIFYFLILTKGFTDEEFAISDVDSDYMWRNPVLRARELTRDELLLQVICKTKCGPNYSCIRGQCHCKPKLGNKVGNMLRTAMQDIRPEEDDSPEPPALRHHIAHFCPNLEEARKCIRGCMKLGKPAFCGKDHVCYCGHRYNSHDNNKPINLDDMYAEFRDLYEKYFGPQDGESTNVENDANDGNEKEEWLN